jgi:cold shock CspA family protein
MATGVITNIVEARGFGFIRPDDGGQDVFFHARALRGLEWGPDIVRAAVTFEITRDTMRDRFRADNVRQRDSK